MKPGDDIWLRVYKSDGSPYRWWQARVEAVHADCIITYAAPGIPVYHNPDRFAEPIHYRRWYIRAYYWPGRRHNLLEIYNPDGQLYELYSDIISPIELNDGEIRFIDHELDVFQLPGQTPQIVDQDEFAEAAEQYGYTEQFMRESYDLANELLEVMANWKPLGLVSG
ncbi:DUF402 domain-containing protein [Promineifilum sp.]|uniref:DUF402 domain-containing protein n=1 Tax=Promineifilum sp. TaxID=2664178 RepID=UPI0035B2677D